MRFNAISLITKSLLLSVYLVSPANSQQYGHGAPAFTPELEASSILPLSDQSGQIEGRFGRLFALNQPFDGNSKGLQPHPSPIYDLRRLGRDGGPMEEGGQSGGEGIAPAGVTFFGQFIDHDITLDVTTQLDQPALPEQVDNQRTINLDLDCVYGAGPEASPYLYDLPKLAVGDPIGNSGRHDLARFNDVALIGDPRNDENVIVSQLQAAFIAFHNAMVDELLREHRLTEVSLTPTQKREIFEEARDHVIHYYHRLLIEDFLPQVIGVQLTKRIAEEGRRFYFKDGFYNNQNTTIRRPFMPIEFSVAAYRFGHSQVRQSYTLNQARLDVDLFNDATGGLRGFRPIEEQNVIDWRYFFSIDGSLIEPQKARRIDTKLPDHLFNLDKFGVVPSDDLGSLAARNLNRGRIYRLPSGQQLAKRMGEESIPADDVVKSNLVIEETPLWYYILQEASHVQTAWIDNLAVEKNGNGEEGANPKQRSGYGLKQVAGETKEFGNILGPVGGTIVGEVIIGLIDHYRESTGNGLDLIAKVDIGAKETSEFGRRVQMQHFLDFAGLLP